MDLSCFSSTYAQAREKFHEACTNRGLAVRSYEHPLRGMQGETLAIDVARIGAHDAAQLMVLSSGCHGVEGFCGSGVQVDLLRDAAWQARCERDGLAVLYIHALNPYGFSWLRRVTNENVDLNRNFRDFSQPLKNNARYAEIAPLLIPSVCPPTPGNTLRLLLYALRHGRSQLQAAVSAGQDVDPAGLFYAGRQPTWSHLTLLDILREHGRQCRRIGWIDVHTGLGPRGVGERIYKGRLDAESIARARRWWGPAVTCGGDGSSSSAALAGTLDHAVMASCPQAEFNGLTVEFGTLPGRAVLNALRAEQWLEKHSEAAPELHMRIKQQIRAAFYPDADDWKLEVLGQSRAVMEETLDVLSKK